MLTYKHPEWLSVRYTTLDLDNSIQASEQSVFSVESTLLKLQQASNLVNQPKYYAIKLVNEPNSPSQNKSIEHEPDIHKGY